MLGTLVNTATVIVGSVIGLLIHKGISQRLADQMMQGLALCSIAIGVQGALKGENSLIMIISMAIGVVIGESIDIDKRVNKAVIAFEKKFFKSRDHQEKSISEGLITSSLVFCIGSMTVIGCMNSGLLNDHSMLFTKATLDFCSSMVFASTLGIGVLLSAGVILVYQGGLTLLAMWAAPLLTTSVVNEMTCVGSLLIIATGLNLLGVTKLKLMNYLPAMFLPILLCMFL